MRATITNIAIDIGGPMLQVIKELSPPFIKIANKVRDLVKLHPDMARMSLMITGLVAVLIPLTLVAGVLSTAIGALLTPIGAVVAGILLFVSVVGSLAVGNKKLRNSLANLWDAVQPLLEPFKMLFELFGGGEVLGNILAGVIYGVGNAIRFLLSPLKAVLELSKGLATGDFLGGLKGAYNAIKEGSGALLPNFGGMKMDLTDDRVASANAKATSGTLNGNIQVSAGAGSRVDRADMNTDFPGNLGMNMAHSRG